MPPSFSARAEQLRLMYHIEGSFQKLVPKVQVNYIYNSIPENDIQERWGFGLTRRAFLTRSSISLQANLHKL